MFLRGLLSNITEAKFTTLAGHFSLCPTVWSMWGGWINVQPRCASLTDDEWASIEHLWGPGESDWNGFPCDFKRENFGMLDGKIVLLDCGELT